MQKTYIIAELGANPNGSLDIAKQLIDVASVAGCDAVKFQKRVPALAIPEAQKSVSKETPWGTMSYLEYREKLEFGKEEYDTLSSYCWSKNIDMGASVWDLESLEFMSNYGVAFLKIPSALITNRELFIETAKWCHKNDKVFIFSMGMSDDQDIDQAMTWAQQYMADATKTWAMVCNSSYPCKIEEMNLSQVFKLKEKYKHVRFGYSGHEFRIGTTVAAIYLGMSVLERHITLDRSMFGTDQLSSIEPQGLIKLVRGCRELELAYGNGIHKVYDSELIFRKKLRGY